ncbi:dihydrofolate reductase family protein [Yaniella halotolerans]|uniref:dihydrofolate reductase family protein n=1 Tax=Yaniella halotolerans TaxID=225453 RepID=UPI0003B32749|nr:dihydrofolate reductase family protein [Yaniella halotolerans]
MLRVFDPQHIRALKCSSDHDLTIDGPTLAAEALRHGLVDRLMILLCPVTVGTGLAFWPQHRLDLHLHRVEQFDGGVVFLTYDIPQSETSN